jgi:hypothetical protein
MNQLKMIQTFHSKKPFQENQLGWMNLFKIKPANSNSSKILA